MATQKELFEEAMSALLKDCTNGKDSRALRKTLTKWLNKGLFTHNQRYRKILDLIYAKEQAEYSDRVLQQQMTVGKLIDRLKQFDSKLPVYVDGSFYADDNFQGQTEHIIDVRENSGKQAGVEIVPGIIC